MPYDIRSMKRSKDTITVANISTIRALVVKLDSAATDVRDSKEDKENSTDKDEEQLAALEEFIEALDAAITELNSAWDN